MKERHIYLDILRIVAIIAIISLHVSGGYLSFLSLPKDYNWWKWSLLIDVMAKWGSAVFLMISGALMLAPHKSQPIGYFLKHRFVRIIIPFVVWVFIYKLVQPADVDFFSLKTYTGILQDIVTGSLPYHMWFVYMIFAMYLITPVASVFMNNASESVLKYYFVFWFVSSVFPQFCKYYCNMSLGIEPYLTLHLYAGFYMLGYYLHTHTIHVPKALYLLIPLGIIFNFYLTKEASFSIEKTDFFYLSRFSVWNVLNAMLIFHAFQRIPWKKYISSNILPHITTISVLSYGVFLSHVLIIWIFDKGVLGVKLIGYHIFGTWVELYTGFAVIIIIVSIVSFGLCYVLSKIPYVRKMVI
ncbi:MAG: acyltransferase [Bacteroidota bacterium]